MQDGCFSSRFSKGSQRMQRGGAQRRDARLLRAAQRVGQLQQREGAAQVAQRARQHRALARHVHGALQRAAPAHVAGRRAARAALARERLAQVGQHLHAPALRRVVAHLRHEPQVLQVHVLRLLRRVPLLCRYIVAGVSLYAVY